LARNLDTLERWFAAFNDHNLDALEQVAHPEIELVPLGHAVTAPPGTTYHGHEGLRSMMAPGFKLWPRLRIDPERVEAAGADAIATLTLILDDGKAPARRRCAAAVYGFSDGRITRVHAFETTFEAEEFANRHRAGILTPREREIIDLLAGGMTGEQVAESLVISTFTVRTHVRNAKRKLGANTIGQAIAIALREPQV
jgi:DNA-binding CsgD family transcriptional regulator/ketosteroid isomerase-like protein